MKRLAFLLAVGFFLAMPGSALAHANLLRAEPPADAVLEQAPSEVRLWFSEPVEPGFSRIQVLDSAGAQVHLGTSRVDPTDTKVMVISLKPLAPDFYTVAWRALSAVDGHVTAGSFTFSLGLSPPQRTETSAARAGGTSFPPAEPPLRWLALVGIAAVTGGFAFRLLGELPFQQQGAAGLGLILSIWTKNAFRVLAGGVAVVALASFGVLLQHLASLAEGPPTLDYLGKVITTRWGLLWLARIGILAALSLLLAALRQRKGIGLWWVGLGLSLLLPITTSLNSHAAATEIPLTTAIDALHLVAATLWLGGLFHFVLALFPALNGTPSQAKSLFLPIFLPRFSVLATSCLGVLFLTGLYAWWMHVGTLGPALDTAYGRALLAKLLLILPTLALGALNLLWIHPRVKAAYAQASLRAFVRTEAVLALLVLLAVGFLTATPTARQELATRPATVHFSGETQGVFSHGHIAPGQAGWNTYQFWLWDEAGPLTHVQEVSLRFTFLGAELGRNEVLLKPTAPGEFRAQGSHLVLNGLWQAELAVKREGAYDLRTTFRFSVPNTAVSPTPPPLPPALTTGIVVTLGVAALGAVAALIAWRRKR